MTLFDPQKPIKSTINKMEGINNSMMLSNYPHKKIWAVGGGKGGVGKSLIAANLSICLAMMGHKVVTIDLDLGGANLHTCLGVSIPDKTLTDYLNKKTSNIADLVTPTSVKNLSIISGAQDDLEIANLKHMQKYKLISKLSELDADYILFDLGAGTTFNTLDFFLQSEQGIITVLPEPTSIENSYRFIKSIFYRKLKMIEDFIEIQPLLNQSMNAKISNQQLTPKDLIKKLYDIDPKLGQKIFHEISKLRPKLVINQVRTQQDIDIGFSMKTICKRYFGIDLDYIGYLDYDPSVWQSVKKRRPLILEFPNSKLVSNFDKIVHRLLGIE